MERTNKWLGKRVHVETQNKHHYEGRVVEEGPDSLTLRDELTNANVWLHRRTWIRVQEVVPR